MSTHMKPKHDTKHHATAKQPILHAAKAHNKARSRTALALAIAAAVVLTAAVIADVVLVLKSAQRLQEDPSHMLTLHGADIQPLVSHDGVLSVSAAVQLPAAVVGFAWSASAERCSLELISQHTAVQAPVTERIHVSADPSAAWHTCQRTSPDGLCVRSLRMDWQHSGQQLANFTVSSMNAECTGQLSFLGMPVTSRTFQTHISDIQHANDKPSGAAADTRMRSADTCLALANTLPAAVAVHPDAAVRILGSQRVGAVAQQSHASAMPEIEMVLSGVSWSGPSGCVQGNAAVHVPSSDPAKLNSLLGHAFLAESDSAVKNALRPQHIMPTLGAVQDAVLSLLQGAAPDAKAAPSKGTRRRTAAAADAGASWEPVDTRAHDEANDMVLHSVRRLHSMVTAAAGHIVLATSSGDLLASSKHMASKAQRHTAEYNNLASVLGDGGSAPVFVGSLPGTDAAQLASSPWSVVAPVHAMAASSSDSLLQQLEESQGQLQAHRRLSGGIPVGHVELSGVDFTIVNSPIVQAHMQLDVQYAPTGTSSFGSSVFTSSDTVRMMVTPATGAALDCKLKSASISSGFGGVDIYASFDADAMIKCLDAFRSGVTLKSGVTLSLQLEHGSDKTTDKALSVSISDANIRWPTADMQVTPLVMPLWHLRNVGTIIAPVLAIDNSVSWTITGVDGKTETHTLGDVPLSGCLEEGTWGDELSVDNYWQYLGGDTPHDQRPSDPIAGYYVCARSYDGPEHSLLPAIGDHMVPQEFEAGVQQLSGWDDTTKTATHMPIYAAGSLNIVASINGLMSSPYVKYTPTGDTRRGRTLQASSLSAEYSDNHVWELSVDTLALGLSFNAQYSAHASLCMAPAQANGSSPGLTMCSPGTAADDVIANGVLTAAFTLGQTARMSYTLTASAQPDRALAAAGAGVSASGLLRSMAVAAAGEDVDVPDRASVFVARPRKRYSKQYRITSSDRVETVGTTTETTDSTLATSGVTAGKMNGHTYTKPPSSWKSSSSGRWFPRPRCPMMPSGSTPVPPLLPLEDTSAAQSPWLSSMFALPDHQVPIAALRLTVTVKDDSTAAAGVDALTISGRAVLDAGGALQAVRQARESDVTIDAAGNENELYDLLVGDSLHAADSRTPMDMLRAASKLLASTSDTGPDSPTKVGTRQATFVRPAGSPLNPYSNMWVPWLSVVGWGPVFDVLPLVKTAALAAVGDATKVAGNGFYWNSGIRFNNNKCIASIDGRSVCSPAGGLTVVTGPECDDGNAACGAGISAPASICIADDGGDINLMQYPVPALLPFSKLQLRLPGTAVLHAAAALMGSNTTAWYAALGMSGAMQPVTPVPQLHMSMPAAAAGVTWGAGGGDIGLYYNCTGALQSCSRPDMGAEVVYSTHSTPLVVPAAAGMPGYSWIVALRSDATVPNGIRYVRHLVAKAALAGTAPMRALARVQLPGVQKASLPRTANYTAGLQQYGILAGMEAVYADAGAARGQMSVELQVGAKAVPEVWTKGDELDKSAATAAQRGVDTFVPDDDAAAAAWLSNVRTLPGLVSMRVWVNASRITALSGETVDMGSFAADLLDTLRDECNNVAGSYAKYCGYVADFVERQVQPGQGKVPVVYPKYAGNAEPHNAATISDSSDDMAGKVPTGTLHTSHWIAGIPDWQLHDMVTEGGYLVWEGGVTVAEGLECQPLDELPPSLERSSPGCLHWMAPGSPAVYASSEYVAVRLAAADNAGCAGPFFNKTISEHAQWTSGGGSQVPAPEQVHLSRGPTASDALIMVGRPAKVSYWMNVLRRESGGAGCPISIQVAPARLGDVSSPAAVSGCRGAGDWQSCVAAAVAPEATAGMWSSGVDTASAQVAMPPPQPTVVPVPTVAPEPSKSSSDSGGGVSGGAVAGIVIGVIVAVALVAAAVMYHRRRAAQGNGAAAAGLPSSKVNNPAHGV